jgi:O-antigen/teichoic acid export membrane protein
MPDIPMTELEKAKSFLIPKLRQVVHFFMKQGIAMGGNLLYGLLCVRMLPVPEYAKFAVLFGFMGSLTVLLDVGISGTLAPLVGEQITNLQLIANYIAALRRLALRLYLIVAPLAALIFILLVRRQHWGSWVVMQMLVVLLFTAWFARVSSSYGAVLILRRDRSHYYRAQMIGSLGSLSLLLIFWAFHRMNIYVGILLNVAQILFIATSYFRRAKQLLGVHGQSSPQKERSIIRLALPNLPGTIFYAIQGQVILMLITVFGHTTSVASIGALSRLSQILVFFSQMNPILVEPFFARLPVARLKRTYLLTVPAIAVCAAAFAALAFLFPEIFLWILGPKYSHLRVEVGLVILASSIRYVSGFMWIIHSARRFVYWWNNLSNIVLTLAVQAVLIWKLDLSTVRSVLYLNIASALVALVVVIACGAYGFWYGPQKMEAPTGLA